MTDKLETKFNLTNALKSIGYFVQVSQYWFDLSIKQVNIKLNEEIDYSVNVNECIQNIIDILKNDDLKENQPDVQKEIEKLCTIVYKNQQKNLSTLVSQQEIESLLKTETQNKICDTDNFCSSGTSKSLNSVIGAEESYKGDYAKSIMYLNLMIKYFAFIITTMYSSDGQIENVKYEEYDSICSSDTSYEFIKEIVSYICENKIEIENEPTMLQYEIKISEKTKESTDSLEEISEKEKSQETETIAESTKEPTLEETTESTPQETSPGIGLTDKDQKSNQSFYKSQNTSKNTIRYNISKIFKNKHHGGFKLSDLPSRSTHTPKKQIISSDKNFQILLKQHNDMVYEVKEANLSYKDMKGYTLFPEDNPVFEILQQSFNVKKSLMKTQRKLRQKYFELKLVHVLLKQDIITPENIQESYSIDDIDVLHFSDFPKDMVDHENANFVKFPILVSSGYVMDFQKFSESKNGLYSKDNKENSINKDFYSVA